MQILKPWGSVKEYALNQTATVRIIYLEANQSRREQVIEMITVLLYPQSILTPYSEIPFGDFFEIWAQGFMDKLKEQSNAQILSDVAEKKLLDGFLSGRERLKEEMRKEIKSMGTQEEMNI